MHEKFNKLTDEKRTKIINVAMKEFVDMGYEKASTNKIASEAGISKGSLFFYFGNKKNMYLFLLEFSIKKYENDFFRGIDFWEIDLLSRMRTVVVQKVKLMVEHPSIFQLLNVVSQETSSDVKEEIIHKVSSSRALSTPLTKGIDTTLFKSELSIENSLRTILWAIDGLSNEMADKMRKLDTNSDLLEEVSVVDSYMKFLESTFYKKQVTQ